MISGILLAAGESKRMGEFKQLLPLEGKTFVEHCADILLGARLTEVVVVTGHRESDVRAALGNRPVRFVHNADYRSGMASSIKCGVKALSASARACVLALVDQPQIATGVINRLVEVYEESDSLIVVPTFLGKRGHPLLLDLKLRDEILAFDPEQGLRQVVRSHSSETTFVDVSMSGVIEDVDLPEDYERLLRH